jgi:predicted metal-dependent peptidase
VFEDGAPIVLRACGGGGTDFRPVFAALEEEPPVALVYLSDLDGRFPDEAPSFPVLWGQTETYRGWLEAPFGECVRVE